MSVAVKVTGGQATIDDRTDASAVISFKIWRWSWPGKERATRRSICNPAASSSTAATPPSCRCWSRPRWATKHHPLGKGRLTCHCDQLPLDVLAPLVRRAAGRSAACRQAHRRARWRIGAAAPTGATRWSKGRSTWPICCSPLRRWGPTDWKWPSCRPLAASWAKEGQIEIEQLLVDCDLGKLKVTGSVNTADMTASNLLASLPKEPCQITGRLDLVRLAALFPAHAVAAAGNRDHGRRIERLADQPTGRRRQQLDRHARHQRSGSDGRRTAVGLEATAGGQFSRARGRRRA